MMNHECDALARHLVGRPCPQDVAERYARAVMDPDLRFSAGEQAAWSAACRLRPLLACLDAGVALWDRDGAVRQRLLVMFALLETTPDNADRFLFSRRGLAGHARTFGHCVLLPLVVLLGTPLGIACRVASGRGRR